LSLTSALQVLGIPATRYHAWIRAERRCELDDHPSCPQTSPTRVTVTELMAIKVMVLSPLYRHMSITTLARHAQRIGNVFLSPSTWFRLIRARGWKRPRRRLHPPKPTLGIRALAPNDLWHVDVTVLRLLDGTRIYISAVIDNFSRMILAYEIAEKLSPLMTCRVLADAARHLPNRPPNTTLVSDSGSENVNKHVSDALRDQHIAHVLAQVDVTYSNSMIEAFWRSLKHQWLYLHSLDAIASVHNLVAFCVEQHNTVMPHSAFAGQTPAEMFFGTGDNVPAQLAAAGSAARQERLAWNRSRACGACASATRAASPPLPLHAPPR
jgi:transposase InsO family protein